MMKLESSNHPWTIAHKARRLTWMLVWGLIGSPGPRFLSPWRAFLLRLFGARIGKAPLICGRVRVLMPWNLEVGDYVAISEQVDIYNYDRVKIGDNTCISKGVWLCTGSHDFSLADFPLIWRPIIIGSSVWVAAEVLVQPGVIIEDGVVVGARSVVKKDLSAWNVYAGNPCCFIKPRKLKGVVD